MLRSKYSDAVDHAWKDDMHALPEWLKHEDIIIEITSYNRGPTLHTIANGFVPVFGTMASFKMPEGSEPVIRDTLRQFHFKERT